MRLDCGAPPSPAFLADKSVFLVFAGTLVSPSMNSSIQMCRFRGGGGGRGGGGRV